MKRLVAPSCCIALLLLLSCDPARPGPGTQTPPTTKSTKRGIAYDLATPEDLAALSSGVSWWYNWSPRPHRDVPTDYRSRYGMDFLPMLWNGNFDSASIEAFLKANPDIQYLLLLNEPNLTDQANMSPQDAARLWPRYESVAANTGDRLGGQTEGPDDGDGGRLREP